MIQLLSDYFGVRRKTGYDSDFSTFMRTAKSKERKKVFLKAARVATEDQRKIIEKAAIKQQA